MVREEVIAGRRKVYTILCLWSTEVAVAHHDKPTIFYNCLGGNGWVRA
jgi:hypothetical protein